MTPDPQLMRRILERLATDPFNLLEVSVYPELDDQKCHEQMLYMAERKLIKATLSRSRPGHPREVLEAQITAKGIDWLNGPEVPTISLGDASEPFELEALRHFFRQTIQSSTLSPHTKGAAVDRLMGFSGAEVKAFVIKLLQAAAAQPEALAKVIKTIGT